MTNTYNKDDENSEPQAFNVKGEIAQTIVPLIQGYRELMASGDSYCIPNWVVDDGETLSEKEMASRWLDYLAIMIKAFEMEIQGELITQQMRKEQDKGLALFAKYYAHLWD